MKSTDFHPSCESFYKKNLKSHFNTSIIIKAFVTALCLSAFIYLSMFGITNYFIHSLLVIAGLWLLFGLNSLGFFATGFFIGIFWFYWIALSFRYYGDLSWLMPFVVIAIGFVYGFLFLIPKIIFNSPYFSAIWLIIFSHIAPFGFNWFNFELMLYYTPFGLTPIHVAFLMLFVLILRTKNKNYTILAFCFLMAAIDYSHQTPPKVPNFAIELVETKVPQEQRWEEEYIAKNILRNFQLIENAIKKQKRLIIFPETAFALYLNKNEAIVERLLNYSHNIAIITGALAYDNGTFYNSAYFFDNGKMERADKMALVPFAEKVPLPRFAADIVNKLFFDGASDFGTASNPSDFEIDGVKFRSAVCFEGSTKEIHSDKPQFISVISNNAWFAPSSEPTLQNLMLSLYATKSNSVIYHSVNGEGSSVIMPRINAWNKILDYFASL